MTYPVEAVSTTDIRCASNTLNVTTKLQHFPKFTHKWSRLRRSYRADEVAIPESVFLSGRRPDGSKRFAGVGGTRSPSVETFTLVSQVVHALAAHGFTIMSGGVPGVDLAAHLAALEVDGASTYAILANPAQFGLSGHEWSNTMVEAAILRTGGFISEYAEEVPVFSKKFLERLLQRDRIISGCCDIFVVFECRENSATVDTAKRAMLQGKTVVAVESPRRTIRVGIEQLVDEHQVPHFRSSELTPGQIAERLGRLVTLS